MVCRERDNTGGWLAASDGTLEERYFYCPNWRGDMSVLVHSGRYMAEWVKYSAYGVPFGLPGGDTNSDGDNDAADATQIQTWIDASTYDVRGDVDLDGDVDSADKTLAGGAPLGNALSGWGTVSSTAFRSCRGNGGAVYATSLIAHSRYRWYPLGGGAWLNRDPAEYQDGLSLYQQAKSSPIMHVDPMGLIATPQSGPPGLPIRGYLPGTPPYPLSAGTDCCRKTYGQSGRDWGWGACCGGILYLCTNVPRPSGLGGGQAQGIMEGCAKGHENGHHGDNDFAACPVSGPPTRAGWPSGADPNAGELDEYMDEINCLSDGQADCKGGAAANCIQDIQDRIDQLAGAIGLYLSGLGDL